MYSPLRVGRAAAQPEAVSSPSIVPFAQGRGRIGLFADAQEFAALANVLSELSYSVVPELGSAGVPSGPPELTAAIVSDSLDRPFDLLFVRRPRRRRCQHQGEERCRCQSKTTHGTAPQSRKPESPLISLLESPGNRH